MPYSNYPQEFINIKKESEKLWQHIELDVCWGYQIQPQSTWRKGLTEEQITNFEQALALPFPKPLRLFYNVMNGLNKPGVNMQGDSSAPLTYRPVFYSYPDDIDTIKNDIEWIYEANHTNIHKLKALGASRIFPIYSHRFMLIDVVGYPILSMHGNDIIYWCKDILELLKLEIFDQARPYEQRAKDQAHHDIKFWLDY